MSTTREQIAAVQSSDAAWLDAIATTTTCDLARATAKSAAAMIRNHRRLTMGDIGEGQEEVEYEPLTVPAVEPVEVPAEPVPVP